MSLNIPQTTHSLASHNKNLASHLRSVGAGRAQSRRSRMAMAAPATEPQHQTVNWQGLKGVLFDIDGTLTNSDPLHFAAFQEILLELNFQGGKPIDEEFYRAHISGRHNPEIAADLFPYWPMEQQTAFYVDKEQRFRNMAGSSLQRMPGLSEFLAWVDAAGLPSAAVTNAPRDNTALMLGALGLQQYFKGVILGEECPRAKPFPDPYQAGLQLLGLQPQEAVVFEDSPAGVRAAVAAGIPVVGITSGHPPEVLLSAGACATAADFAEVMDMVQAAAGTTAAAGSGNGSAAKQKVVAGVQVVASCSAGAGGNQ